MLFTELRPHEKHSLGNLSSSRCLGWGIYTVPVVWEAEAGRFTQFPVCGKRNPGLFYVVLAVWEA